MNCSDAPRLAPDAGIARATMLLDAHRFGFDSRDHAARYLDDLLARMDATFEAAAEVLDTDWAQFMRDRLRSNLALLRQP